MCLLNEILFYRIFLPLNSIYNLILKLPLKTIIYPGHHYGHILQITLKENILISSFFKCEDKYEFIKVMQEFENNREKI